MHFFSQETLGSILDPQGLGIVDNSYGSYWILGHDSTNGHHWEFLGAIPHTQTIFILIDDDWTLPIATVYTREGNALLRCHFLADIWMSCARTSMGIKISSGLRIMVAIRSHSPTFTNNRVLYFTCFVAAAI